ncbi:hypothetical protein Salat_1191100 [Sesamum alatum]|uniref:Uncharacterized protein n=1 Tax=Sesamum alatum TaxID=300844 RepID=A0AAE2CNR1_9LAMI|nr:hypothetical protein Salat_1191100 [Sesamum alatum]
MNARIPRLSGALRGRPAPVVAARSSDVDASVACEGDPPTDSSEHPVGSTPSVPVELAGGESREVAPPLEGTLPGDANTGALGSREVEVVEVAEVAEGPSKKHRRKNKKHRSKSSSKSSKRSKSRSERRAAKDATKEGENTKHLKEMVVWWKQAREELMTSSSRTSEMEGEKLDSG